MTDHARQAAENIAPYLFFPEPDCRPQDTLVPIIASAIAAATADLKAENQRLRRFVTDQGKTCWACEQCGHATSGVCLHCQLDRWAAALVDLGLDEGGVPIPDITQAVQEAMGRLKGSE